jgi:hypothetical protein
MVILENEEILAEMNGPVVIDANSADYIGAEVGEISLPFELMIIS